MGLKNRDILWIFLLFSLAFLVGEISALFFKKIADLGVRGNVRSSKVNVDLLGYKFEAVAETPVGEDIKECDAYYIFKMASTEVKVRSKPKGNCTNCCKSSRKDVRLKLFTKRRLQKPLILSQVRRKGTSYRSLYNATNIIIYIHGYMEITEAEGPNSVKNAYLSRNENIAVIIVEWPELSNFLYYKEAATNVKLVAKILANFLESYIDDGVIDILKVHVIGFSLGAQVASFIGKYLRRDLRLPRITGLDPAYPGYDDVSEDQRINPRDAEFVDIIHTDGGRIGFNNSIGHLDFFPNGGTYYQPGCEYNIYDDISCSHNMAYKLYTESINSPYNFPAVKCHIPAYSRYRVCNKSDIVYMGFAADPKARGSYYLKTNKDPPYGRSTFDINS